jgi:uncharacterized protein (DUF1786 family)
MHILLIDIGTGTQDILLLDTRLDPENGFKMVVPSPTMIVRRRIEAATRRAQPILLTGRTMGGGPSHWAVEAHLRAGLPVFATPPAARSFNDDLDQIAAFGIRLVSDDEAAAMGGDIVRLELRDFDYPAIRDSFAHYGVALGAVSAVGVAVFDHGAAPPGYSDRKFRFEYIERRLRSENRLSAFAFAAADVPEILTRMRAVVDSAAGVDAPVMLMDTAPAAVLGALLDPSVRAVERPLVANIGNFHTLAFQLGASGVEGVFEHHTGMVDRQKMESLLARLAEGSLTDGEVFMDGGHGARIFPGHPGAGAGGAGGAGGAIIVGPRRSLMAGSPLEPRFAAPFGDMMLTGCFGMLAAMADIFTHLPLREVLSQREGMGRPPWELG